MLPGRPEWVDDFIFFMVLVAVAAMFLCAVPLGIVPDPPKLAVDVETPLATLLIVAITLSGIAVPASAAYMSLGRATDVFSGVGDAAHFFMKVRGLTQDDLVFAKYVVNLRKDKTDNNNFVVLSIIERILDKIAALEEIILLGAASATHMSFGAKLRLLSKQLERPFWVNFEAQNDQHALTWYAHVVGVAALLCVAGLFLSYVPQTMPGIVVLGKFLAIGTVLLNILVYAYLARLAWLRRVVESSANGEVQDLCKFVKSIAENLGTDLDTSVAVTIANMIADDSKRDSRAK